jgi:hypothetical protein
MTAPGAGCPILATLLSGTRVGVRPKDDLCLAECLPLRVVILNRKDPQLHFHGLGWNTFP